MKVTLYLGIIASCVLSDVLIQFSNLVQWMELKDLECGVLPLPLTVYMA